MKEWISPTESAPINPDGPNPRRPETRVSEGQPREEGSPRACRGADSTTLTHGSSVLARPRSDLRRGGGCLLQGGRPNAATAMVTLPRRLAFLVVANRTPAHALLGLAKPWLPGSPGSGDRLVPSARSGPDPVGKIVAIDVDAATGTARQRAALRGEVSTGTPERRSLNLWDVQIRIENGDADFRVHLGVH